MTLLDVLRRIEEKIDELLNRSHASQALIPEEEVWLDNEEVMKLLFIERRTFYRRRSENLWVKKKIGGKWYYLKSSLFL
ncbi:MAG: hypothetical protein P0Y49_05065 [Candidatus Pedobacter colombiensis]|uniref:Uncharacterized protein n=1 Tax=Candidatus Pedobacter colombiensis TaxID=3121371 RepID=A0AAJ6B8H0_9SPHI|nr:hypothetical protein [Pedobacter sp.]WEK20506.1 MAG: hypothetical protein P0Y49_05065 [Pedobacter sp.]